MLDVVLLVTRDVGVEGGDRFRYDFVVRKAGEHRRP